jgi:hypothetical protein
MTAPDLAKGRRFLAAQGAPLSLVVGVTGAHYYGFPSPDSDLDLKGIHVEPTARVVSLAPAADTIDHTGWFEQLEIDYTSHELGFALRLLLKGNGNILERILTPFQLLSSGEASELQQLAAGGVCRRFFHHYRGFFGRMCTDFRRADPPTVKGALYAYRSALTGIHLMRTGQCVGDVGRLGPLYGFARVAVLVERKAAGTEHGALTGDEPLEEDFQRLEALLSESHAASDLPETAANVDAMDAFLVRMRRRNFE